MGGGTLPPDAPPLWPPAQAPEPGRRQKFFPRRPGDRPRVGVLKKNLLVSGRRVENAVKASRIATREQFYIPSLSYKTIVYKGMLKCHPAARVLPDLADPAVESALALVHSRFSTNTFPNWARAHPYRYICHNGEINTLRGNINWMHARESLFASDLFGDDIKKILPVIDATAATPRCSTTCSRCWRWPAARCRTR